MYENYINIVEDRAKEEGYPGAKAYIRTVGKNGGNKTGIMLKLTEDSTICPTAYPEDYSCPRELANNLIQAAVNPSLIPENIQQIINNPDKTQIIPCLINTAKNSWAEDIPHRNIADLTLYYRMKIHSEATATITKEMAESWNMSENDLFEQAMTNVQPVIQPLSNFIMDIGGPKVDSVPVHIVSNIYNMYGASLIIKPDIIRKLFQIYQDDLLVLPSSIHEVLILSAKDADLDYLRDMVTSINRTTVSEKDFLSDNVYTIKQDNPVLLPA